MKTILWIILFLCIVGGLWAQTSDLIYFGDSPTPGYYDPSWGYVKAPSQLERIGEKFPVDADHYFQGQNSLRLSWTSAAGGDWGIALAATGWPGQDITPQDTLTLWVLTEETLLPANLPLLYLEDLANQKTDQVRMSAYVTEIPVSEWFNIRIPLQPFKDNPGGADLTKIKTIFFGQDQADGQAHLLYIDEVRMVAGQSVDVTPPQIPQNISAKAYEKQIVIQWDEVPDPDVLGYNIYRTAPGGTYRKIGATTRDLQIFSDFIGHTGRSYYYKISAVDYSYNESDLSDWTFATTAALDDEGLLTMTQEITFHFFWDYAHPVSGLARERYPGDPEVVTIGGSGMGIMTFPVAIERDFITREAGAAHVLKMLEFLQNADRFHGAWPHWMNGTTGKVIPFSQKDNGGDLVETAFMAQGLLTIRQYFDAGTSVENEIVQIATQLWEEIEWDWYRRTSSSNYLYWHWSPDYEWAMNMPIYGFNEAMIIYLLAIASPTHPVPASLYENGWASSSAYENGKSFYGIPQYVGWDKGGPLFFTHYSFLGFDPRGKKDSHANYYINNRNITLINRAYCIENPGGYTGYGENCWGLTASDDPLVGYMAHEPVANRDNGTISPTAALSAFAYTPEESMAALKHFYRELGENLVGALGFKDAFNQSRNWYAGSYIAIDQGPIILMIENYRSGLLWEKFMANEEIQSMLDAVGFVKDTTTAIRPEARRIPQEFEFLGNYPNPFNPATRIRYAVPKPGKVNVQIFNISGQLEREYKKQERQAGYAEIRWDGTDRFGQKVASGIYLVRIGFDGYFLYGKMLMSK